MNFRNKFHIKNSTFYYFNDIIKLGDLEIIDFEDFDNILIDEKWHENILIYDVSYITSIGPKLLRIRLDKIDGIIRIYAVTRYSYYLVLKIMMPFTVEPDI